MLFDFKIGADPEFLFFHNSKMSPADRSIQTVFSKQTEFPATEMGYKIGANGILGWDGHSSTGELRPAPSANPQVVAKHIGEIVRAAATKLPFLTMTSLSIGSAIGGHIHLEIPREGRHADRRDLILNRTGESLGRMLATFLTPILASEHRVSAAVRMAGGSYGKSTDIRMNEFNGGRDKTVEVRGLTAEWTCHPTVALATLTYMGVVWNEILKRGPTSIARSPLMIKTLAQATSIQNLIISEYGSATDGLLNELHKHVKTFELYNDETKALVDSVFNPTKMAKLKESVGWNLTKGWASDMLENQPKTTKRVFLSDKKVQENLKKIDLDAIHGTMTSIAYNDDFNMGKLMDALSKRLTAFSLQLQNSYYFYGLKKGANDFLISQLSRDEIDDSGKRKQLFFSYPTNMSRDTIITVGERMISRISGMSGSKRRITINPLTGKNDSAVSSNVVGFGIPYELREQGDVRTFLAKLWDLERGVLMATKESELTEQVLAKDAAKQPENAIPQEIMNSLRDEVTVEVPASIISNDYNF